MQAETTAPYDPVNDQLKQIHQQGIDAATTTGDMKADPTRATVADNHVGGLIEALHQGPLNPEKRQNDALILQNMADATEWERCTGSAYEHAKRKSNAAQEAVPAPEPPPSASAFVIIAAIIALALTFAMSLAALPLFEEIDDAEMRLLAGFAMGFVISATCIASIYQLAPYDEKASVVRPRTTNNAWGVTAGLFVLAAFGLIRMSTTGDDLVLTIGLVALDGGILLYTKSNAAQHQNKIAVHAERLDARIQKLKAAEDALREFQDAEKAWRHAINMLRDATLRCENRLKHDFDLNAIRQAARWSWREGYQKGIDFNRNPRSGAVKRVA